LLKPFRLRKKAYCTRYYIIIFGWNFICGLIAAESSW
jgi:hypothetical protein